MVESEIGAIEQTNQLKDRIDNKPKVLPRPERLTANCESLVMFQDLEDLPLVVQQWEFEIWWKQTDALYFFTDGIPAYVIDEEVFVQWLSAAKPNVPQAFECSDAMPLATHHALMLSLVPFNRVNPATGKVSPDVDERKVFFAVVVFVHPSQKLSPIEEAVDVLIVVSQNPQGIPVMALCQLPQWSIGEFYPCPTNNTFLVLSFNMGPDGPILHLDMPIHRCDEFAVWRLHRWIHPCGPVPMLPLLYSPDPRLPNVFQLNGQPMLWTNTEYLADASDNDVNEEGHPALTFIHTSRLEINANSSQISLTDDDYIQYITVNNDAKNSTEVKRDEAAKVGEPTATPKKAKTDKPKGNAKDGGDSHSDDQDNGMFSDGEGQQPSNSTGFQGWSDDEVEGDEPAAVANIVRNLEEDQQDSGIGTGGDGSKSNIVGIVSEGQVMVDMATHSKVTRSGTTMDHLRCLGDDTIELSRQLNYKMELAALALFDKVKAGFSSTGGVAQQFVGDISKLATNFFMDARVYEAQLDSADTEAFHSAVLGLQEKVDSLLRQAATLKEMYKHSKASFDNILATMHQEIHDFTNQASHCLCNEYKHCLFNRIMQDHPFMDVTQFMSNVIQNVCTFDALLTSHQLGWSVVPLQILMVPILMEAMAMPCHLEFVQYLTKQSLHVQWSIWVSNTVPAPAPHPAGINLESEQENPGSFRPKTSDPDSLETRPVPCSVSPDAPSKPAVTPMKPGAMPSKTPSATPSKTPSATPTKPPAMPLASSDPSLGPPAMPRKCALRPQKAVPGSSGDNAKDILDCVTARYRAGMSPQYSNVLVLLTSGKSSQAAAPKQPDPDTPAGGGHANHPYVKLARSDSDSDCRKVEPHNKRAKHDPGSGPEVADAGSHGSKKSSKEVYQENTEVQEDSHIGLWQQWIWEPVWEALLSAHKGRG